jgi:hypothetical protein
MNLDIDDPERKTVGEAANLKNGGKSATTQAEDQRTVCKDVDTFIKPNTNVGPASTGKAQV